MEVQRNRHKGCGTLALLVITYPRKLNSISRSPQLVNKGTKETVAESHSHRRSSIFRKPRDMSLEICEVVSHAVDLVLLTFILVWSERQSEAKSGVGVYATGGYQ